MNKFKKILPSILIATTLFVVAFWVTRAYAYAPIMTYEDHLYEWVDSLAICETGQNPDAVNWFDGGSPSYGYVQFKEQTWEGWNTKLNLPYTFDDIMDKEAQRHVAVEIIKHDWKQWRNWYNCHTKYGVELPPKNV